MNSFRLRKYLSTADLILLLGIITSFLSANYLHTSMKKPGLTITKQDSAINLNKNVYRFLHMGNKRLLSDILWIQTLLESDEEHYSKPDLNSWMYHRFSSISLLDPHFYENYLYGGIFLSIVKDDPLGASDILSKGIKYFPEDYRLNYYIAFNYIFELGFNEKGLFHLDKIKDNPKAPKNIHRIADKLRLEVSHNYEIALEFLKTSFEETKDPKLKEKIKTEIYAVKAERDLKCLNQGDKDCEKLDLEGQPYLRNSLGLWQSPKPFSTYRLKRKPRYQ